MKIEKEKLFGKVDEFIINEIQKSFVEVEFMDARSLIDWRRLDLAFKLFFLKYKNSNIELAKEIYQHDIRSQTLNTFRERGNADKNSFDKYLEGFIKTFLDLEKNGYDVLKSLIPLSKNETILNGAHRLSSAIYLNQKVACFKTEMNEMVCDYLYFLRRNVPVDIVEIAVREFVKYADNVYVGFLWPSGKKNIQQSLKKFNHVVYRKTIFLSKVGAFNLLYRLYKHMDWIGIEKDSYAGLQKKLIECFPERKDTKVEIIFFQESNLSRVRELKNEVRLINNIGFSSIHITDTKDEAVDMSELLLNNNTLDFFNRVKLKSEDIKKISMFKEQVVLNHARVEDFLIVSSFVLHLYNIRKSSDVDYLSMSSCELDGFDEHSSQIVYYKEKLENLIYDQRNYFEIFGVKCLTLKNVKQMKINRAEKKDEVDVKLLNTYLTKRYIGYYIYLMKQNVLYFKIKTKEKIKVFLFFSLKKLGLYNVVRSFYRRLKNKYKIY